MPRARRGGATEGGHHRYGNREAFAKASPVTLFANEEFRASQLTGQEATVYFALVSIFRGKATCEELEIHLKMRHQTVSPTLLKLEGLTKGGLQFRKPLIKRNGEKRYNTSGRRAEVYQALPEEPLR
jgi:hypothetical protein